MEILDLIQNARRLAKKAVNDEKRKADIKIGVVGSTSIQYFVMVLRYLLDKEGIIADIYEGEYDGIAMDIMDTESKLYGFNPQILIIIPDYRDIKEYPVGFDTELEIEKLLSKTCKVYEDYWSRVSTILDCQIIQSNFVIPPENVYGNLERSLVFTKTSFLERLNVRLRNAKPANVILVDLDMIASNIGKWNWFDDAAYYLTKTGVRMEYLEHEVNPFVRIIKAKRGCIKKCIVLDLDNTIWGGIVGDEGYDGIRLDPNDAIGEAYRDFQKYLLELKQRGVLLAVVSKNDESNAKEPFIKNTNMVLSLNDISSFCANWNDKVTNIKQVANELNIGTDSLVFFDDNPAERDIVRKYLPEVQVIEVPDDPSQYKRVLDQSQSFDWMQITKEDILRSDSYVENRRRESLQMCFDDYDDYLKSLNMKGTVRKPKTSELPRFTQLLNKSNQFNLRTKRYSESEVMSINDSKDKMCLSVQLSDKFSKYGIIACVILEKKNQRCFIESWVMSCRVLKRGVENMTFRAILETAKNWKCTELIGEYIPTKKNGMVSSFLDSLGFKRVNEENSTVTYIYDCCKSFEAITFIKNEEEE